jgi:hypothetical protein
LIAAPRDVFYAASSFGSASMGIETSSFLALCKVLAETGVRPARLLSLGYPDLLVHENVLRANVAAAALQPAADAEQVARWHGWTGPLYDTDAVFRALGAEPTYIDIYASRHVETIVDLNQPWQDAAMAGAFDVVFDGGTTEHCFNVGQAFANIVRALKTRGFVIHTNPVSMCNHGFWNFNPTTYIDFYSQNGFDIVSVEGLVGHPMQAQKRDFRSVERMQLPPEVRSLVVARKLEQRDQVIWPTQSKYLGNRELKKP